MPSEESTARTSRDSSIEWSELPLEHQFETEVELEYDSLLDRLNPLAKPETETHKVVKFMPFSLPKMAFYACRCGEHTWSGPAPPHISEELNAAQERAVEEGDYEDWMLDKAGVPHARR